MKRTGIAVAMAALLASGGVWGFKLKDLLKQPDQGQQAPAQNTQPTQPATGQQPAQKGNDNAALVGGLAGLLGGGGGVGVQEEVAIGRRISGNLLGAAPLVNDEALQRYVNRVGRWVALQTDRPDLPWTFGVIESEDINAFAAPGGYVFVTKGLYRKLNSEAELAGVLAHEVGHVIKKHHLKVIQKQKGIAALSGALGKQVSKDGDNKLVQKLIGSGAEIMARGLDKDAEFEADRVGVVVAARAGYEPFGLPSVLQEIGHVSAGDNSVALLFKTHPHPDERLARLGDAIGERFDSLGGRDDSDRFYRLKK
jgi:predicted Zn-dependent protease